MTKQEEIREGIEEVILPQPTTRTWVNRNIAKQLSGEIIDYLHSQGVVIKVDRELPKSSEEYGTDEHWEGYDICQEDILKAGYVAVEPLIKEKKDGQEKILRTL